MLERESQKKETSKLKWGLLYLGHISATKKYDGNEMVQKRRKEKEKQKVANVNHLEKELISG